MKFLIVTIFLLLATAAAFGQGISSLTVAVINKDTKLPVEGAAVAVEGTEISTATGADGRAEIKGVPDGSRTITVSSLGYETAEQRVTFPAQTPLVTVLLTVNQEVGEVIITTTRTGREIDDVPTRVEAIDEEEIDEKINMQPSDVSMLLNESTGIDVQQTSAASATQSIRIQGLDGRYTQILKDGFPSYGGFSGGLSVLEIPPLDLKQVEVIKGPSATFYGGGAIAGVVNFVSKEPEDEPVTTLLFNQTSAWGTDVSVFNSRKFGTFGYTLLGSANYQREYDVDDDHFTELPRIGSFNISPRLFFYIDDKTRLSIGNSTSYQKRKGGDVLAIRGRADEVHRYFEENDSFRNITTISFDRDLSDGRKVIAKQSIAFYDRRIEAPEYRFGGRQFNSYTDVSYYHPVKGHALVFGFNAVHDRFREDASGEGGIRRDETRTTFGGYVQDAFSLTKKLSLEAGFRLDHEKTYGFFALPRVSLLYQFTENLSTRFSYGLGYKTPSMFTEDAETLLFRDVLPVGNTLKAERSQGGTFDINYRRALGEEISLSLNHMFFYTVIDDPLVLEQTPKGFYFFRNADRPVRSRGIETNAKLNYGIAKLFVGYTFTDARAEYLTGDRTLPLIAKHRINSALIFEEHENFKAGVEAYYTGRQRLSDGTRTPDLAEIGLFAEKTFGKFSVFFNAENITDVRQGRYSPVVVGPHQDPSFAEIYTHTEGRVFNGGVKIRF